MILQSRFQGPLFLVSVLAILAAFIFAPQNALGDDPINLEQTERRLAQKADSDPWKEESAGDDPWGDADEAEAPAVPWEEEKDDADEDTAAAPWAATPPEGHKPFELSGRFWNRIAHDLNEDDPFEDDAYNHAELLLKGTYNPGPGINLLLSLDVDQFQYYNSGDWDNETNIRAHEAYVRFTGKWFEFTLGNQLVRWGKTDQISPLDIVNPEDVRDGLVRDREERKLPIPMVNLKLFKDMYKFEALFIPFFKESKLHLVGRDWALFKHYDRSVGPFHIDTNNPPNDLKHSEFGFRFAGTFKRVDYAFSYLRTREDIPSIMTLNTPPGFRVLDPDAATVEDLVRFAVLTLQPIQLNYRQQHVYGIEFETTWGDFGIRGDFAYISERSFLNDRLQQITKPAIHYALGVDYSLPGSFYANLQFSQQIIHDFEDGLLFADKVTNTVNGKLAKELWDGRLELALRYLYNFTRKDYYVNPFATLKYWQDLTLQLGVNFVGGPDESTLGLYDNNDDAYFILTYHF